MREKYILSQVVLDIVNKYKQIYKSIDWLFPGAKKVVSSRES